MSLINATFSVSAQSVLKQKIPAHKFSHKQMWKQSKDRIQVIPLALTQSLDSLTAVKEHDSADPLSNTSQDLPCHKINQIIFIIDESVPLVYRLVFIR